MFHDVINRHPSVGCTRFSKNWSLSFRQFCSSELNLRGVLVFFGLYSRKHEEVWGEQLFRLNGFFLIKLFLQDNTETSTNKI